MEIKIQNLRKTYLEDVVPTISKEYSIKNKHAIPQLDKIVLNVRVGSIGGSSSTDKRKRAADILNQLKLIAGQQPVVCAANKSVANFKLREGDAAGVKVTLRGDRMYAFLEKMIYVALPRMRNFKGLSIKSIDAGNNFTLTVKDSDLFPEGDINFRFPISVTLVPKNSINKAQTASLMRGLGLPILMKA